MSERAGARDWDCVIIGGGPAGLTAATYLGRFKRPVIVIDAGKSRLKRVPLSRNVPGFPDGIAGRDLHARLHDQASRYGARFRAGMVEAVERNDVGFEVILADATIAAPTVLIATGARLFEPALPDLDDAMHRGLLRYCPICDGFETEGKAIAVLGARASAIAEAHFLRTYSERVTYIWQGEGKPSDAERKEAEARGIAVSAAPVSDLAIDDRVRVTCGERAQAFDILYPCLGCEPQSDLARSLGAEVSSAGGVIVDAHQQTTVPGVYAAGDVLQGLDQISSACGQAAIAATAIHNLLAKR